VDPGTYYLFKITILDPAPAPVPASSSSEGGEEAVPESAMFGWISAPRPPQAVQADAHSVRMRWDPLRLHGSYDPDLLLETVYVLEGAEGFEQRSGIVSKHRTDISNNDYKVIARGSYLTEAKVMKLKSGIWYNWRLTVQYMGNRFSSEYCSIATSQGPAPMPHAPTLVVKTSQTPGLFKRENRTTILKFMWKDQPYAVPAVKKYQLQIKEVCKVHHNNPPHKPSSSHGHHHRHHHHHHHSSASPGTHVHPEGLHITTVPDQTGTETETGAETLAAKEEPCACTPWRTAYSDVLVYYKCPVPSFGAVEWHVRVRSWNSCGWSNFSELLVINYKTHSDLFPAGFVSDPPQENKDSFSTSTEEYNDDDFENIELAEAGRTSDQSASSQDKPPSDVQIGYADDHEIRRYVSYILYDL
jgi:hypothetical protein